jgi:hypothetical protein
MLYYYKNKYNSIFKILLIFIKYIKNFYQSNKFV